MSEKGSGGGITDTDIVFSILDLFLIHDNLISFLHYLFFFPLRSTMKYIAIFKECSSLIEKHLSIIHS